jgi:hypothetical protein
MLNVVILNVAKKPFMLSVIMLNVGMLNVGMLNVANKPFMLSVVMLNVEAPYICRYVKKQD